MTAADFYPTDVASFKRILDNLNKVVHVEHRLPLWPFRAPTGIVDICQYSHAIEGSFEPVLQALAAAHDDTTVSFAAMEPDPHYYRENYGSYPAFVLPAKSIGGRYWDAVSFEPIGDPTGSVAYTANVAALVGSSGRWAVWAERSWDIALVLSQHRDGAWTSAGVEFVSVENALANFTEPDFKTPLEENQRTSFIERFRRRGSGA
ncbi:hypothetical protein ACIPY2_11630 [Paenarthrobacter sp. NPDC089675]|uniref:hypothetical protein n=1 Tax=Paenarthrobacter sp. NPDC089675 TaxID=3364376 RepID=UPI003803B1C8